MASFQELCIANDSDRKMERRSLLDLPNEVLIHILASFDTLPLLQLRAVAHRFQSLIIRIVQARLLRAASLKDRKLILECYHPSAQYTEPYLFCDYLGTPGLSGDVEGQGSIYEIADEHASEGTLRKLYSRFRPTRKDPQQYAYRTHPAGDIPGTRTSDRADSMRDKAHAEVVSQNVNLDAHELFTQLRLMASLVQVGPSRGFFLSIESIVEKKTTRLWRHWLAERAKNMERSNSNNTKMSNDMDSHTNSLVWVDQNKIAGLKVRVKERNWRRDYPVLLHKDEDQAVSYSLELEELVISTTHLLLAVERSLRKTEDSGKAMVFGSFMRQGTQAAPDNAAT